MCLAGSVERPRRAAEVEWVSWKVRWEAARAIFESEAQQIQMTSAGRAVR